MTASAYVFCAALQTALPTATHSTSITFPLVQDTRPITADWPALADTNGTWIYFDAQIQYACPMLFAIDVCCLDAPCFVAAAEAAVESMLPM